MKAIAFFKSPYGSKFGIPRQSGIIKELQGEIHFEKEFHNPDALKGLEGFDYLWIIWKFSANPETIGWKSTVRPPRLGGNVTMGVFATRSPFRPNPIGLSSVKIEHIDTEAMVIYVSGADLMDGTPIYDIKPYIPYSDSHPDARAGFTDSAEWKELEVCDPSGLLQSLPIEEREAVRHTLALDPRPHYKPGKDPKKYGCLFNGKDIRFTVSDGIVTVVEIRKQS